MRFLGQQCVRQRPPILGTIDPVEMGRELGIAGRRRRSESPRTSPVRDSILCHHRETLPVGTDSRLGVHPERLAVPPSGGSPGAEDEIECVLWKNPYRSGEKIRHRKTSRWTTAVRTGTRLADATRRKPAPIHKMERAERGRTLGGAAIRRTPDSAGFSRVRPPRDNARSTAPADPRSVPAS